jgi:hypothetical protein
MPAPAGIVLRAADTVLVVELLAMMKSDVNLLAKTRYPRQTRRPQV